VNSGKGLVDAVNFAIQIFCNRCRGALFIVAKPEQFAVLRREFGNASLKEFDSHLKLIRPANSMFCHRIDKRLTENQFVSRGVIPEFQNLKAHDLASPGEKIGPRCIVDEFLPQNQITTLHHVVSV
jgi:hypothetical protein